MALGSGRGSCCVRDSDAALGDSVGCTRRVLLCPAENFAAAFEAPGPRSCSRCGAEGDEARRPSGDEELTPCSQEGLSETCADEGTGCAWGHLVQEGRAPPVGSEEDIWGLLGPEGVAVQLCC